MDLDEWPNRETDGLITRRLHRLARRYFRYAQLLATTRRVDISPGKDES